MNEQLVKAVRKPLNDGRNSLKKRLWLIKREKRYKLTITSVNEGNFSKEKLKASEVLY
jgi:hypothetical protein